MQPKVVLEEVIFRCQQAIKEGKQPVVAFDLDATLFDNGPRTWQILVDFAEKYGHTHLRRRLDALPRTHLPYLLKDIFIKMGYDMEAADNQVLMQQARDFWMERFFTDEFQRYDEPIAGAPAFAKKIFEMGATLVYLSGRDAPNMLVGCSASLRHHGFPIGVPHTALALKPDFHMEDYAFKKDAARFISHLGTVIASFDNEPGNCNLFLQAWPGVMSVLIETHHAPNPPPLDPQVVRLPSFILD